VLDVLQDEVANIENYGKGSPPLKTVRGALLETGVKMIAATTENEQIIDIVDVTTYWVGLKGNAMPMVSSVNTFIEANNVEEWIDNAQAAHPEAHRTSMGWDYENDMAMRAAGGFTFKNLLYYKTGVYRLFD